jgi:repeat uncharacterized protein DUF346
MRIRHSLRRARIIAVASAVGAITAADLRAQIHVVGIDQNNVLVHNRRTLSTSKVKEAVVQVAALPAPSMIRITNRAGFDVKVYEYNAGDAVMAVARKGTVLRNNASMTVPNNGSNIKVFRPALLDQYLTWYGNARTDLTIARSGSSAKINAAPRQYFTVVNNTQEDVKIAIYNYDDAIRAIPKFVVTLKPGATTEVKNELGNRFRVSVFWPQALDWIAWSQVVNQNSRLTITKPEWTGWQQVRQAGWVKSELAVDDEANASGRQSSAASNEKEHYLYALDEYGEVWQLNLGEETVLNPPEYNWSKSWTSAGYKSQVSVGMSVISIMHDIMKTGGPNEEIFALDTSGQVITRKMWKPSSEPWTKLGGKFVTRPAAVGWGPRANSNISVYAIDASDRTLREMTYRAATGKWNRDWANLGGSLVDAPWVLRANGIHVFARGTDNALWHRVWREDTGWKAWESLGGNISSSPTAVTDGNVPRPAGGVLGGEIKPIIRVFARGAAEDYQTITWDGDKWGEWVSLGGKFRSAPVAF